MSAIKKIEEKKFEGYMGFLYLICRCVGDCLQTVWSAFNKIKFNLGIVPYSSSLDV